MFLLPLVKMYVMFTYGTTDKMVYRLIPMKANKILKEKLSAKLDRKSNQGMKTIVHIQGNLIWKWGRTKRGGYIAICDPIGQTVEAKKFGDLLETIQEALDSTLRELFSSGDLEKFLKEQGWKTENLISSTPRNVRFDMPFDVKGVQCRDLKEALC